MKILVADDDALIRRLLAALLGKLGHEVELVEDGAAAWKALERPDQPALAILDWVMPGLSGLEVCQKLRAQHAKSRTYVLLLSAKSEKHEVIAGLDAGADDYLVKPFDPMALLARLRVAQRIIDYQQELQTHIGEMERMLQRHNLLGEMFGKQSRAAELAPASSRPNRPEPPVTDRGSRTATLATPSWLAPVRLNELLIRGLAEIRLGYAQGQILAQPTRGDWATFTAWAPMVLLQQGLWLDLLLETDEASAVAMFRKLLGRVPVSEREQLDFLAETFNLLCTTMRTTLAEEGRIVLTPVISRSIRTASLSFQPAPKAELTRHRLALPNITLNVSVLTQATPIIRKTVGQLRELDILAENLPTSSTRDVFLLNQGVVLNLRYIDRLTALAKNENKDFPVPVIEPSPLTESFCNPPIHSGVYAA